MIAFINRNIHYPQKARKLEIDGTAIMRFTVREDGSVSEIKALRGICAPLEEECVRVIRMMPKWTPGEQNGQATSFQVILPISFDLITGY